MNTFEKTVTLGTPGVSSNFLPDHICTEDAKGKFLTPLLTYSFDRGIIPIKGAIDDEMCMRLQQLLLIAKERRQPIRLLISSPGGSVNAGLAIIDALDTYPYDVDMYVTGIAASMAALLCASGRKGRRYIAPHSKVMIHEPLIGGGVGGSATSIVRTAESIMEAKHMTNRLLADYTGRTLEEIDKATAYDHYFSAEEAIAFGLCDKIGTIFEK